MTAPARIGVLTISDRASAGVYADVSGPAICDWLARALCVPFELDMRVIPDGFERVRDTLIDMADVSGCCLVLTTGGTGRRRAILRPRRRWRPVRASFPGLAS